jgi:hypothetical protein
LTAPAADFLSTAALACGSVYAFWFAGYRIWRRWAGALPREVDPLELSVLELGLGASLGIFFFILAGALKLYSQATAYLFLAGMLLGPHRAFIAQVRARSAALFSGPRKTFLAFVLGTVGVTTLLESLAPVTSQDALVYHLAVPARYVAAGGIVPVEGNFFAQFPQNIEMLFTLGLLLKGPSLAQWYHWMLGALAAASVAALSRALFARASGLLAAAVFATLPTVTLLAGWAYVDLGVVFFIVLSMLCFVRWQAQGRASWLFLSALFSGVAAGSKYTAGFQGILLALGVIYSSVKDGKPLWSAVKSAARASTVVGLAASPWWIKNILYTGNPLYPFCFSIFGGSGWDAERARVLSLALSQWGGTGGILETILLPWRLTMSSAFFSEANFDGVIGCAFLIGAPIVIWGLGISRGHRTVAFFIVAHAVFWLLTSRQVRFLLPALAFAAALMGASVPALMAAGWLRTVTHAMLCGALLWNTLLSSLHFAAHNPLPVVLGLEPKKAFLEREVPGGDYAVFEYIEEKLPEESFILFGSLGNPGFLCKRRYYSDAFFENHTLAKVLKESPDAEEVWTALRRRGFTHLLFRWDCVFDPSGRKSEIPLEDQKKLMDFLNQDARALKEARGTVLYELGHDLGPLKKG